MLEKVEVSRANAYLYGREFEKNFEETLNELQDVVGFPRFFHAVRLWGRVLGCTGRSGPDFIAAG